LLFYEGLPQATCPPERVRAGGSAPQVKRSSSHAEGVTILERSDHLEMAQDRLEECVWSLHGKGSRHSKAEWEATSRPTANGFLCRGKLWLQESTPEKLKGEGE